MSAPNPMVTFFKQINVTNLVKISKKYKLKFNMLLCWCIGKAASEVKEFYILPVQGKLYRYDKLAVNTIVRKKVRFLIIHSSYGEGIRAILDGLC